MDVFSASDVQIPNSLDTPYDLKHSCANRIDCTCMNATVEDSVILKLGNALSGILHVQDVHLELSGCNSFSVGNKLCSEQRATLSEGFNVVHSEPLNVTTQEKSNYYGPSYCSEEEASNLVSFVEKDEVSDISLDVKSHTNSKILGYKCTPSVNTCTKPVSAMKGSREKLGIQLKKLTVTWSPDVYDPPCNSISHTVRSHSSQRSRNRKDIKHRHKGKSSQGSNSSKRYKKHVGKTDYRPKSSPSSARLLFGDYNQSLMEIVDFNVTKHDSKCGSSFLGT